MSTKITQPPPPSTSGARRTNALPSGYVLEEYRIDAILGAGGFGVTYKAMDTHLNTWVAIKEYFPVEWSFRDADGVAVHANTQGLASGGGQLSDYEWGLERFLDEARVLARIQHPYVVRVKRYFRANGTAYIVMEYEEGEPLSRILDESETLSEEQVRGLLEDVLPALQATHDQGYLHRDIKPANLYVRARDHRVMLIDFGAARAAIGRHSRNVTSLVTPGYSPPEQYTTRNDRYGTWTDLYALGAVLYRCVTGHAPAEAAERLLDDRLESAVAAGAGRYSVNLLRVIDRALAVRPETRFRDVAEMRAALMGLPDDDSDKTVIVAPVKAGKRAREAAAQPITQPAPTEPTVKVEGEGWWPETAQPLVARDAVEHPQGEKLHVESPPPAVRGRELLLAASVSPATQRRAPAALLMGAIAAVAAMAAVAVWWWPSAPAPKPSSPPYSLSAPGQPVAPPVEPVSPAPAAGTAASSAAPSPLPVAGTLPVEPAAPAPAATEASALSPVVETTAPQEPAPVMGAGVGAPAGEQPAPLPEPEDQSTPPVQVQQQPPTEQGLESPPAAARALPSPTPALAPHRVKPRRAAPVERAVTQSDVGRKSPARTAQPSRASAARLKQRRRPARSQPIVVTPAAPVRSVPKVYTSNPWDPPTATGFNQK